MHTGSRAISLLELLLEKQVITPDVADVVRQLQADSGKTSEQVLMEVGALSEDDLAVFISEALQVRYVKLEDIEVDREAVRHVPAAVAHRHRLIPLRRSGQSLVVAFADPADPEAQRALNEVTDFDIVPLIARGDAIEHALYVHYGEPRSRVAGGTEIGNALHVRAPNAAGIDSVGDAGRAVVLNRQWTFEQFIEDAASQFPLTVAKAVAEGQRDAAAYNPFHCWGAVGCGKSHLLHAIANYVSARTPLKKLIVTTGPRFADSVFEAIRDRKLQIFRYLFTTADLLIIDDADSLLSREWAQSELVEILHEQAKHGKQLVIASRVNLYTHPGCEPQLRDALAGGVTAGFGEYSVEAKLAMIGRRKGGIALPQEMLDYLARRCGDSVSDLFSVLQDVSVLAVRGEQKITLEVIEDYIRLCTAEAMPAPGKEQGEGPAQPKAAQTRRTVKRAAHKSTI